MSLWWKLLLWNVKKRLPEGKRATLYSVKGWSWSMAQHETNTQVKYKYLKAVLQGMLCGFAVCQHPMETCSTWFWRKIAESCSQVPDDLGTRLNDQQTTVLFQICWGTETSRIQQQFNKRRRKHRGQCHWKATLRGILFIHMSLFLVSKIILQFIYTFRYSS